MSMDLLEGKTLAGVEGENGDDFLDFAIDGGEVVRWDVYGDCCSTSWIDDIDIDCTFPCVVTEVDEGTDHDKWDKDLENSPEYEVIETLFATVKTTTGRITLTFRNDSNGYYGSCVSEHVVRQESAPEHMDEHPTEDEMVAVINETLAGYPGASVTQIMGSAMRRFEGKANPAKVRALVEAACDKDQPRTFFEVVQRLLADNPRDRAIRVDRRVLEGVLAEMEWAAGQIMAAQGGEDG